ncbi:replication initiator protein A [Bacillus cihuensis]|uniref:replication initiator protein A n=1 Tax=Bacillus cihuensis TaxID=1208599 RepID=UPI00041DBE88|nr:replication initiator protein A [Bacillus cihuensis]
MERFFTIEDNQTLIYFQMPKVLMLAERYRDMSNDAKLLYMYYLDLNKQSMMNGWKDKEGHYYIKFSDEKAMEFIRCAKQKLAKLKKELRDYGLIKTKKTGQGYVDKTYVLKLEYTDDDVYEVNKSFKDVVDDSNEKDKKAEVRKSNFFTESKDEPVSNTQAYENQTPRSMKIKPLEVRKSNSINKNNSSKNNLKENNSINKSSSSLTEEQVYLENEPFSKKEEEEIKGNMVSLGNQIASSNIMKSNKQINSTLKLMIENGIYKFDAIDIHRAIEHYKAECFKRGSIARPPSFFVTGFELKWNERYSRSIGNDIKKQYEPNRVGQLHTVKDVPFYNWLEV